MADREDAALVVQLAQWGATMGLQQAAKVVLSDDFDPDTASLDDDNVVTVCNYYETVGTLTKNGLLSTELVLDWLWVSGAWARVEPAVAKLRAKHGVA
ncbi:MAG: hypothetical protein QOH56_189, partial [Pseudonocardiales bacterium]|nr:hypothetical protein [Pseudonocardiales bacterium]